MYVYKTKNSKNYNHDGGLYPEVLKLSCPNGL